MDLSANLVRKATALVAIVSCHFIEFRRAKMYQVLSAKTRAQERQGQAQCCRCARTYSLSPGQKAAWTPLHINSNTEDFQRRAHPPEAASRGPADTLVECRSNLPPWDHAVKLYHRFSVTWQLISWAKHLMCCVLDSGALNEHHGYLDCLLPGRVLFNPRVVGLFKYVSFCILSFHLMYEFILLKLRPPLRIYCLEFLLMSPNEIAKFSESSSQFCSLLSFRRPFERSDPIGGTRSPNRWIDHSKHTIDDTNHKSTTGGLLVDRPNRSARAWRWFANVFMGYLAAALAQYLLLLPFLWLSAWPMIVTKPGFEISYRVCVEWLARQDQDSPWRRLIYNVTRDQHSGEADDGAQLRQRFFLPLNKANWVHLNAYQALRIAWDVIENLVFQVQWYVAVVVVLLPSVIIVVDVCWYCREIATQCELIMRDGARRRRAHLSSACRCDADGGPSCVATSDALTKTLVRQNLGPLVGLAPQDCDLSQRVAHVQALVMDLFHLVREYNHYTDFYVCFCIFIWCSYSLICSSWLFMPAQGGARHETRTVESYGLQATATLLVMIAIGAYSTARNACVRLYKTLSSVASLQEVDLASRQRWAPILQHYKPLPLYCICILRTYELSWLFALEIGAWLLSVLFVLTTFRDNLR